MSEVNETFHNVVLPSKTAKLLVTDKTNSERIRAAWKLYGDITDGVAKKLASYVCNRKGEVLKDVVESFKQMFNETTEMVHRKSVKSMLGFPSWC